MFDVPPAIPTIAQCYKPGHPLCKALLKYRTAGNAESHGFQDMDASIPQRVLIPSVAAQGAFQDSSLLS